MQVSFCIIKRMSLPEMILIGIGLAMDAFAVSISKGLSMRKINYKSGVIIALAFGVFQAGMPVLGWLLTIRFERYISAVDHWIAFGLLLLIGVKAIWEAVKDRKNGEEKAPEFVLKWGELLILAVATSIDALAVGISFAVLNVTIWSAIGIIGGITFCFSFVGVLIGNRFGVHFKSKAEIAGGIILILLGIKILLEHLGILSF